MPFSIASVRSVGGVESPERHRTFKLITLLESTWTDPLLQDGPDNVMNCDLLPKPGNTWAFGTDQNVWAYCLPGMTVSIHEEREGDAARVWKVEQTFSTKPPDVAKCSDNPVTDPLQEPPQTSGSGTRFQEEASFDRFGNAITTSSHEPIRGPRSEFDASRTSRTVVMNVGTYQQVAMADKLVDFVNAFPMWGNPPRCVKLAPVRYAKKYYGQCYAYYQLTLELEIYVKMDEHGDLVSGFDRDVLDEGTKALSGDWDATTGTYKLKPITGSLESPNPDPLNPQHFTRFRDRKGEFCNVVLDGFGLPANMVVMGTETVIGASVNPGVSNIFVVTQPTTQTKLSAYFHDPYWNNSTDPAYNPRRLSGTLLIEGTVVPQRLRAGLTGAALDLFEGDERTEIIEVRTNAVDTVITSDNIWKTVTAIEWDMNPDLAVIPGATFDPAATIVVKTNLRQSSAGKIHIEKYPEADLITLLNLPTDL